MGTGTAKANRKPRADSIRNRELLIEAATQVFSAGGQQASLEAVARQAGVGIGTLYRHFPTREALFEAVYRREVDQLGDLAERLAREAAPVEALRRWMHANVRLVATKKGMVEGLQLVAHGSSELKAYSFERLTSALALLLDRGVATGELRADVTADDLLRTLIGIFYAERATDWQPSALRLVDVFVDGLRTR
jgi:AcrR family transcriptional regulator